MKLLYKSVIEGKPVAQGRPRFVKRGNFVQTYDPKTSKEYKTFLKNQVEKVEELFDCPMKFILRVYRSIPSGTSKVKAQLMEDGEILPITKPDVDNYLKGVLDAFTKVLWVDDSLICDIEVIKRYSKLPRIEFEVYDITR